MLVVSVEPRPSAFKTIQRNMSLFMRCPPTDHLVMSPNRSLLLLLSRCPPADHLVMSPNKSLLLLLSSWMPRKDHLCSLCDVSSTDHLMSPQRIIKIMSPQRIIIRHVSVNRYICFGPTHRSLDAYMHTVRVAAPLC